MALFKSNCLVIRARNFGEADRILVLLSEEHGKFEAVVKGARRQRSRFVGNTLPFNYFKGLFLGGRSMDTLSQAELVHSFAPLREDLVKLAYASFWAEMVDSFLPDREEAREIFLFLLAAFVTLEKSNCPGLLNLAFEMRLLNALGYQPELDTCIHCGTPVADPYFFAAESGGVLCYNCRIHGNNLIPVTSQLINKLQGMSATDLREISTQEMSASEQQTAGRMLRTFIEARLDHPLKAQVFLDSCLQ